MVKKRITQVPVWVAMACIVFVLAPMGIWYISRQYQEYENEINTLENRFLSNTQQDLRHWMDSFFSTAEYYESRLQKRAKWVVCSGVDLDKIKKEMQSEILGMMETSLLGAGEYAFAMDKRGRILLNNLPELIERDSSLSGTILERSTREPDGFFVDLPGKRVETGQDESKLIYVRRHGEWGWIMGIGVGMGKVDAYVTKSITKLRMEARQGLFVMGTLLLLISVAVFLLGHFFKVQIELNFAVFQRFFHGAVSSGKKIDVTNLGFQEFVALAHEANAMMDERLKNEMVIKAYTSKLKKVNKRLKAMSFKDGLTGVANRRRFDEALQREWDRAMRSSDPISLIMMDIDFFKVYNDTYGHPKGDECLKQVARVLQDSVKRSSDLLARYGGEEFAAIVPNTPGDGVLAITREIRDRLAMANIPHKGSSIGPRVTLSMGLVTLVPSRGQRPEELIECADKALYRAKSQGRDRVEVFGAENNSPGV
jgi:diguanylate cyclase (GGDEF)-like protein